MRLAAAALALSLTLPALAREKDGVQLPETADLGGQALVLNGAGLRSKLFIKVYVGALYLPQKSGDAKAIVAADAPWLVNLTFKRDVDKKSILGAFKEGFEKNSAADLAKLQAGVAKLEAGMRDMKSGEVLGFAYQPGTGTTVTAPGSAPVVLEGQAMAAALLRNWIGEHPADGDLKKGMLGQ